MPTSFQCRRLQFNVIQKIHIMLTFFLFPPRHASKQCGADLGAWSLAADFLNCAMLRYAGGTAIGGGPRDRIPPGSVACAARHAARAPCRPASNAGDCRDY
jgi:hypothetical protein